MSTSIWEAWASEEMRPGGRQTTLCLLEAAGIQAGAWMADIGCGTGASVSFLNAQGFHAVGVDISHSLCEKARARGAAALCADAQELPFFDGEMDALLFECTLSVLVDVEAVLFECARVLKAGGMLLVSDVYYEDAQTTRNNWADRLSVAGFSLVHWEEHPEMLSAFRERLLWEVEDVAIREGLCETGCAAAAGYFTMVAKLSYKAEVEAE